MIDIVVGYGILTIAFVWVIVAIIRHARKSSDAPAPTSPRDFTSERARRYHGDNSFGR